jgi:putative salt-induced outer membrane protein YdiY
MHIRLTQIARGLLTAGALALGSALSVTSASAQPAPIEQHIKDVKAEPFQADANKLNMSLGGGHNAGNTQAWQINAASEFEMIRGRHGLGLNMSFAYGRANVADDPVDELVDTVRNMKTRARYDFFLTPMDALFVAAVYRWDTFAGLDGRAQGQLGYMRNIYKVEKHRLWAEVGYDLTYDNYDPDPLPDPVNMGLFLAGDDVVHSARLFAGYDNQLNAQFTFRTGLEGLINVEEPEDLRLAWDNSIRSAIGAGFDLEFKFTMLVDTLPVPGADKVDTTATINLMYTLL